MLSRASNKMQNKKKKKEIQPFQPTQNLNCPAKCAKGIQIFFSCCQANTNSNNQTSSRGKDANASNYSSSSNFNKVLYNPNTSFND